MLEHMPHARHTVILDGKKMDVKTITCFVNNIYNLDGFDSVVNKKR
jgi:hypothetical protein